MAKRPFNLPPPPPPDGELVELSLVEFESRLLRQLDESSADPRDSLWELARFYNDTNRPEVAVQ